MLIVIRTKIEIRRTANRIFERKIDNFEKMMFKTEY